MRFRPDRLMNFLTIVGLVFCATAFGQSEPDSSSFAQRPQDVFAASDSLRLFDRLANQIPEMRNQSEIAARVRADQQRPDVLTAAVIDTGMDLFHPELVKRIMFDVQGDRVVGAGLDPLGGDRWASSQLVDPTLLVIGAKAVEGGRIVQPVEDPLRLLKNWNQNFVSDLRKKILADPILAKSPFAQINAQNLNLIGVLNLSATEFDGDLHQELKAKGQLLKLESPNRVGWEISRSRGWPEFLDMTGGSLERIPGGAEFLKLLQSEYQNWSDRARFEHSLKLVETFLHQRVLGASTPLSDVRADAMNRVQEALLYETFGPRIHDPLEKLLAALRRDAALRGVEPNPKEQVEAALEKFKTLAETLAQDPNSNTSEREQAKELLEGLPRLKRALLWALEARQVDQAVQKPTNSSWIPGQSSAYRRWLQRASHPLVQIDTMGSDHGSHVGGILAQQDERLRLFPLRVALGNFNAPPSAKQEAVDLFLQEFKTWLKDPLVRRATLDFFAKDLGVPLEQAAGSRDLEKQVNFLAERMGKTLMSWADSSFTTVAHHQHMKTAIEEVGRRKLMIANLSLGGADFPFDLDPLDRTLEQKLPKALSFLAQEFQRQSLAATIERAAPHTIFVLAAGNDSMWTGGKSMSTSPADLGSEWLARFEDSRRGEVAPGNRLKNQVVVGSLNEVGRPSSYTNLILSTKYEMVFIRGEQLLSAIERRNLWESHSTSVLAAEYPELFSTRFDFNLDDARLEKLWDPNQKEARMQKSEMSAALHLLNRSRITAWQHLALTHHDPLARFSGTSMASPALAGLLGKAIIEKAVSEKQDLRQVYGQKGYRPQDLIPEFIRQLEKEKIGSRGVRIRKAQEPSDRRHSPQEGELRRVIEELRNGAVRCEKIF